MRKIKIMEKIIKEVILIIFIFMLLKNAAALGIGPAYKTINFRPGLSQEIALHLYNTDNQESVLTISSSGDLTDYIKIKNQSIALTQNDSFKTAYYEINLPKTLKPGTYEETIRITEVPRSPTKSGTITSSLSVTHKLALNVPSHGKYVDASLDINNTNFIISLKNIGGKNISAVNAEIIIYENKEKIFNITAKTLALEPEEKREIKTAWNTKKIGEYNAVVIISYDEFKTKIERDFNIGEIKINIEKIEVNNFKLGEIAKIELYLESNWNKIIKDVYADVIINRTNIKTELADIEPGKTKIIPAYWDTKNLNKGAYDANVVVHYKDKIFQKLFEISMYENKIKITPFFNTKRLLILLLVVLIVFAALVYQMKKK